MNNEQAACTFSMTDSGEGIGVARYSSRTPYASIWPVSVSAQPYLVTARLYCDIASWSITSFMTAVQHFLALEEQHPLGRCNFPFSVRKQINAPAISPIALIAFRLVRLSSNAEQ